MLVAAGVVAFGHLGLAADEEQPRQLGGLGYSDAYDLNRVRIDVCVLDNDDTPVTGLTRDAFRLLRDGGEVAIKSFAALPVRAPDDPGLILDPSGGEAGDRQPGVGINTAQPVYLILYIDSKNLRYSHRIPVLRALQDFVNQGFPGPVQIMVVNHLKTLEIVQSFTSETDAVSDALRSLRLAEAAVDERDEEHQALQKQIRRAIKGRLGSSSGRTQEISNLYSEIRAYADDEGLRLEESLNALRQISTMMTGIAGRKCLVYVSNGLPLSLASDLLHQFAAIDSRFTSGQLTFAFNRKRLFDALAAALGAQEISVYAIDATGTSQPRAQIGESDTRRAASAAVVYRESHQASLRLLAAKTGGMAVVNTDEFAAALERIRTSLTTYYSLEYDRDTPESDTVHTIEVELDNLNGYELRYSTKTVEKSVASQVRDEVTSLLFFGADDNPMGIEIVADPLQEATPTQWMQPLTVLVPVTSLTMTLDGDSYIGRAALFFSIWNREGRGADSQRQAHTFQMTSQEYEQRRNDRFPIDLRLLLSSGENRIAIAVLDEVTNQTSRLRTLVTIPGES